MFTGIIEELSEVHSIIKSKDFYTLNIKLIDKFNDIKNGDSIALNGVCLTVVDITDEFYSVNIIKETLNKTNLIDLNCNSYLNVERAMLLSSRIDGHLVQGHIEGTGKIVSKNKLGNQVNLEIELDNNLLQYCIVKGSIALDGISLTIANINNSNIRIAVIPYTYDNTILKYKKVGEILNIETDMFAKYVQNFKK